MNEAYVAFGSNIGDRAANIHKALQLLREKVRVTKTSAFYETKPMYVEEQAWFLNGVAKVETELPPRELLAFLKNIELIMGRKPVQRNGPRIIDLDILFYSNQIIEENDMQIPHPKMAERAFVMVPLAEISPNFTHPISHKTVAELLSQLKYNKSEIKKVDTAQ